MAEKHKVEIFSAGCSCCLDAIEMVRRLVDNAVEVTVLDMSDPAVVDHAKELGIRSVPFVLINGKPADCCSGRGPNENTIKAALNQ